MVETAITQDVIPGDAAVEGGRVGAELVFWGRVRDREEGRRIVALDYEHYAGMTERELRQLGEETAHKFPLSGFSCLHRVGRVPVGEASLKVVIRSEHRGAALDALAWFIRELKVRVPIWKWGVTPEGERFASKTPDSGPAAD